MMGEGASLGEEKNAVSVIKERPQLREGGGKAARGKGAGSRPRDDKCHDKKGQRSKRARVPQGPGF